MLRYVQEGERSITDYYDTRKPIVFILDILLILLVIISVALGVYFYFFYIEEISDIRIYDVTHKTTVNTGSLVPTKSKLNIKFKCSNISELMLLVSTDKSNSVFQATDVVTINESNRVGYTDNYVVDWVVPEFIFAKTCQLKIQSKLNVSIYALSSIFEIKPIFTLVDFGTVADKEYYVPGLIQVKYDDIRAYIREGKIIDEGCADGALFVPIARDFRDSDLVGIEISNDFIARAQERIREGHFGGSFVTILQANLLQPIFEDDFSDTVICNSTTHEIWSYNNKEESLKHYLSLKYKQLREDGRLIIRDVVGPKDFEKIVLMRSLNDDNQLFRKFMRDFKHLRPGDTYEEVTRGGVQYIKANMKIVSEYLLHKDYLDNWESEVQEEFCHLNANSWRTYLEGCNFKVVTITEYRSDWIVKNRFEGQVELYTEGGERVEYPNTNIVIVAEK